VLGSSSKETIVPASERKIVFSGLDAIFNFHHDSFLPALETATELLLRGRQPLSQIDSDGQLSSSTASSVANVFLLHAAFMRMYSSYVK
jgi:hypothetical protein